MAADSAHTLSRELRNFIATYIHSVEQLEVLILLSQEPIKAWRPGEAYRQILSSEKSVTECLEGFRNAGLAEMTSEGGYRISSSDQVLIQTVFALGLAYRERRVSVIKCIYKKPSDPIQNFADAFRLRKEK